MHPFERLTAWQKSHEFTLAVLQRVAGRPRSAHLEVVNQLRGAAISVTKNIVEGSSCSTAKQFAGFLRVALSSARECSYLIRLAAELGVISLPTRATLEARCDQVCRLLAPLLRHVDRAQGQARPIRASAASRHARSPRAS